MDSGSWWCASCDSPNCSCDPDRVESEPRCAFCGEAIPDGAGGKDEVGSPLCADCHVEWLAEERAWREREAAAVAEVARLKFNLTMLMVRP